MSPAGEEVRITGNSVGPHRGGKGKSEGRDVIQTLTADEPVQERRSWVTGTLGGNHANPCYLQHAEKSAPH